MNYTHKILKNDKNLTEIEVTVEFSELDKFKDEALMEMAKDIKVEGFRPGKAPRAAVEEKLGPTLLNEAVGRLLGEAAYQVITKEDFKPLRAPQYDVKKLDPKDGIIFVVKFTNYPKVVLGDFSKIKVTKESGEITEEEIDDVIKNVIRNSIKPERIKELTKITGKKTEQHGDHTHEHEDFELNDALVAELKYENEKTLKDIREAVKPKMKELKESQREEAYTNKIVEEAIKLSEMDIPDSFIDTEVKASEEDFNARLKDLKLDPATYLATQGKTIEDMRKDWEKLARERASIDLLLINISMKHDLMPTDSDIEEEIGKIKDAKVRSSYENESGREYIRTVLARRRGVEKLMEEVEKKN